MTSDQRAIVEGMRDDLLRGDARVALTAALGTCGNCAHSDQQSTNYVCCTLAGWPYNGKLMTTGTRCEKWTPQS